MKPLFLTIVTFVILASVIPARGDIPPDPGYTRVRTNVVLEIKEPIPEYRFFLVSDNISREIFLKPGDKTLVDSPGGGARNRSGTLVAVPVKNLQPLATAPAIRQTNWRKPLPVERSGR